MSRGQLLGFMCCTTSRRGERKIASKCSNIAEDAGATNKSTQAPLLVTCLTEAILSTKKFSHVVGETSVRTVLYGFTTELIVSNNTGTVTAGRNILDRLRIRLLHRALVINKTLP